MRPSMADDLLVPPAPPTPFVGRKNELDWLRREVNNHDLVHGRPIVFLGAAGIGKTALVAKFLVPGPPVRASLTFTPAGSPPPASRGPIWIPARDFLSNARDFRSELKLRTDDRREPWPIIILDGAEDLGPEQQREAFSHIFNFKLSPVPEAARGPCEVAQ